MDAPENFETDETRAAAERARAAAASAGARPDWLVGADEGVEGELERRRREAEGPAESPVLRRPEAPAGDDTPRPASPALRLVPPGPEARPKAPARPEAWKAAASSLPTLRVVRGGADAVPAAPPRPTADARDDDAGFADDAAPAFPDDGPAPAPAPVAGRASMGAARIAPPREAWWAVALDAVRSDRRWQVLIGLVVVLLAVVAFWPRGEKSVPISSIRRHPERWDGVTVRLSGRVGEVFAVGGGHAFYLHQGRDTMVVFTRTRQPVSRERISVSGSISTGYLDGVPRQALFEDTK